MSPANTNQYKRERTPIILIVCEGRNKTEKLFFDHFITRKAPYSLKIEHTDATDIKNMAKTANRFYKKYEMSGEIGDRAFCLVDLDLNTDKLQMYEEAVKTYPHIEFIVSNPCFEVWLLYYFTENPKVCNSSQEEKEYMGRFVKGYNESYDVIGEKKLHDKHDIAVERSLKKNRLYGNKAILDRNPYTEVHKVIMALKEIMNKKR